jgi:hypothetical protein
VGDPVTLAGITGLLRRRALARVNPDSLQLHRIVQAILRDGPSRTPIDDMTTVTVSATSAALAIAALPGGSCRRRVCSGSKRGRECQSG